MSENDPFDPENLRLGPEWYAPKPAPFTCEPRLQVGGRVYRYEIKPDATPAEMFWLLLFRERMGAREQGSVSRWEPESVLAWLAQRNLLRHLEPEGD